MENSAFYGAGGARMLRKLKYPRGLGPHGSKAREIYKKTVEGASKAIKEQKRLRARSETLGALGIMGAGGAGYAVGTRALGLKTNPDLTLSKKSSLIDEAYQHGFRDELTKASEANE